LGKAAAEKRVYSSEAKWRTCEGSNEFCLKICNFEQNAVSHKLYKQFCGLSLILSPSLLSLVLSLVGICPVPVAGYLPDGTPMNRAGNAVNHPETIGPDPHTPGSPLPRAEFVNSIGYLPDGTAMNAAGLEGFEWWIASGRE
jgi:hypothetical protein